MILLLLYFCHCISLEAIFEKFSDQQLLNRQSDINFNAIETQKEQKENLKKSYLTKKKIEEDQKKDCFELNKQYILEDSSHKILNCK